MKFVDSPLVILFIMILAVFSAVVRGERRRVPFKNCPSTKSNTSFGTVKPARSKIECSAICLNDPACLSASYCKNPTGSTCQLSSFYVDGTCTGLSANVECTQTAMGNPCENGGTYFPENRTCQCIEGFLGVYCQRHYRDCSETPLNDANYTIQPLGSDHVFDWKCGRGNYTWVTAFMSVFVPDYTLSLQQAKEGIPIFQGYFFLGLENLHQLTKQGRYDIYIVAIETIGKITGEVVYTNIRVDSAENGYALNWDTFERSNRFPGSDQILDGFGGNGDVTTDLHGARFGTHDNDINGCARAKNASWWYNPLGCTALIFDFYGLYWPMNRSGTVSLELSETTLMFTKPVYWYVKDDLVL